MDRPQHSKLDDDLSILFEPIAIGPVTAKNRFYQAPHGNGFGHRDPNEMIEMRKIKAQGGWAVIATEQTEIHPSSDMSPFAELRIWDKRDIPTLAKLADVIHEHDALAALELSHSGLNVANLTSGLAPLAPSSLPVVSSDFYLHVPVQSRAMDKRDIRNLRNWQIQATRNGIEAGYDIIYVYASLLLSLPSQFLSPRYNLRTDEYGGSLKNRMRLLRELIEDTLNITQSKQAVAVRFTVDDLLTPGASQHPDLEEFFDHIGHLPDLWDLVVCGMGADAGTSRFNISDMQIDLYKYIKSLTQVPIASVSFINEPKIMAQLIRDGVVDILSAARPSIADPFLPNKIRAGKEDEIRHCIKCNTCISGELGFTPVKCTQNPTFGESWRKGWHPEVIEKTPNTSSVMIIGTGPAGLEAGLCLSKRGFDVQLFEAREMFGGRAWDEAKLPGLQEWRFIYEDRLNLLVKSSNVELNHTTPITVDDIIDSDVEHVVFATGAKWLKNGLSRNGNPMPQIDSTSEILTVDDIYMGHQPGQTVCIYDDDNYYLGGVIAELLVERYQCEVTLVTPATVASCWTFMTMEQFFVQKKLLQMGVKIVTQKQLKRISNQCMHISCIYTDTQTQLDADSFILITARKPNDKLFQLLLEHQSIHELNFKSMECIGDAYQPALIANAIHSGHMYARKLGIDTFDQDTIINRSHYY